MLTAWPAICCIHLPGREFLLPDDLLFIWLVLLNEYVTPVPEVANTTKGTDLPSLMCMIKNCGQKIVDCVSDPRCKAGLDCLEGCAFNDQVMHSNVM
jgi:hypothetical protein